MLISKAVIFKALDKLCHEGLILKLKQNGISGDQLHFLSDFLSNAKQRNKLNEQNFSWTSAHAGVPQRSIQRTLLFLIYINDFVDDTLFSVVHDGNASTRELKDGVKKINNRAFQRKMSFNPHPSKQA